MKNVNVIIQHTAKYNSKLLIAAIYIYICTNNHIDRNTSYAFYVCVNSGFGHFEINRNPFIFSNGSMLLAYGNQVTNIFYVLIPILLPIVIATIVPVIHVVKHVKENGSNENGQKPNAFYDNIFADVFFFFGLSTFTHTTAT